MDDFEQKLFLSHTSNDLSYSSKQLKTYVFFNCKIYTKLTMNIVFIYSKAGAILKFIPDKLVVYLIFQYSNPI